MPDSVSMPLPALTAAPVPPIAWATIVLNPWVSNVPPPAFSVMVRLFARSKLAPNCSVPPLNVRPPVLAPGIDGRAAGVGVRARQRQRAAAGLGQRAAGAAEATAVLDDAGKRRREVVAADRQVVRAQKNAAGALDRAGRGAGRAP